MGRQHTTWISDETWRKLENIKGDSISEKIRNAIDQADPDREFRIEAEKRQLGRAKDALKRIASSIEDKNNPAWGKQALLDNIALVIEDVYWLVVE
jgi:predicted CopG family antitoxin